MLEFAKLVEQNAQLLAALATLETGVPLERTRSEVDLDHETGPWLKIYETSTTYNCAHLRSTKESLKFEYFEKEKKENT